MSDVTQIDREAAAAYMKMIGDNRWSQNGILSGGCDKTSVTLAFANHRIAAEKASDVALATAYQCGYDTAEERAEKAVMDRLRQPESLERMAQAVGRETVRRDDRGRLFDDLPDYDKAIVLEILDAALADALETKPIGQRLHPDNPHGKGEYE